MVSDFKVLTLNCWGVFIPTCTVRKNDRLNAIAEYLLTGLYDIVLLQEIWTDNDYKKLQDALAYVYEFSTYFHSHTIGSGMCVFSKWPIDNILFHRYSVNGYPQLVHQADWYCGKGVGLLRVNFPEGYRVNFYVTHLIARYELDRKLDRFQGHRTSQLIELVQFICATADSSDAIVIAGDFNLEPNTPDIQFFKQYLGLCDAWIDSPVRYSNGPSSNQILDNETEIESCTCDRADNPYRNNEWTVHYGNGERLDYIFYRTGNKPLDKTFNYTKIQLTCHSCWLDMRQVPNDPDGLHYSDHVGVGAQLSLHQLPHPDIESSTSNKTLGMEQLTTMQTTLLELAGHISLGLSQCYRQRNTQLACGALVMCLILLILRYGPHRHWIFVLTCLLLSMLLSIVLFMLLWASIIDNIGERRALTNSCTAIQLMLSQIKAELNMQPRPVTQLLNGDHKIAED